LRLTDLFPDAIIPELENEHVNGLSADSRDVKEGYIFIKTIINPYNSCAGETIPSPLKAFPYKPKPAWYGNTNLLKHFEILLFTRSIISIIRWRDKRVFGTVIYVITHQNFCHHFVMACAAKMDKTGQFIE